MIARRAEDLLDLSLPENPFPGLRPFEFNEALLYFGRDGQSEQLLKKLAATRFLAVVGTSGSGKSSLVRAGLLPALYGGFMTSAGSDWLIALMRPGNDPIGNLARALAAPEVLGPDDGDHKLQSAMAESTLRRGSLGLVDLVQQARIGSKNLLIVADQFEELFRFARAEASESYANDAAAFVKLLLEASRQREHAIYVVLTMRSDFLGDCADFWGLPEAINEGQYLIPRLTRAQRREAITGPVAVCGGTIADRLVTRMLNDMGDDQDQLPILQHALMRTWGRWKEEGNNNQAIDLEHYCSIGQMADALSLHADEAFNSLPDERSRLFAERVFKGLTEKGPDNREIRRPVTFGALCALASAEESELAPVIDAFRQEGRSFLMPPAGVSLTPATMIDISHESLIRNWQRLKGWVDEEARSARTYRRLAETAALQREGKAGLERDPGLQIALTWREQSQPNKAWAARYHPEFDEAIAFLDESLAAREAEEREREARRQREAEALEKETRRSRQIKTARLTTAVLGIALLICLASLVYANRQRHEANRQRQEATNALAEAKLQQQIANDQKEEADRLRGIAETAAKEAGRQTGLANRRLVEARKSAIEASNQRKRADQQAAIARRDAERATRAEELNRFLLDAANLSLAQVAHEGNDDLRADDLLRSVRQDSRGFEWYYLWKRYHPAERTIEGFQRPVTAVAFSPADNNRILTASADGTVALVDTATGKSTVLETKARSIWSSVFSPDGKRLATLGDYNTVEVWDVDSGQKHGELSAQTQVESIAFGKDGKLATGNENGTITLWDAGTLHEIKPKIPYPGSSDLVPDVGALAFSRRGDALASGYEDGVLRIWDLNLTPSKCAERDLQRGKITALAISPDDKLLAVATEDGYLVIWATGGINLRAFEEGSDEGVPLFDRKILPEGFNCLAFSADGQRLATAGPDKAVAVWQMNRLRSTRSSLDSLEKRKQSIKDDAAQLKELEQKISDLKNEAGDKLGRASDRVAVQHRGPITSITFSADGHTFASGSSDGTVKVSPLGDRGNQERGAISPDGRLVAAVEGDALMVREEGRLLQDFHLGPNRGVNSLTFSPDNNAIAIGFSDHTVKLYRPGEGKEISLPKGQWQIVSPDGRLVAIADGDAFEAWDTSSGKTLYRFQAPASDSKIQIRDMKFSPDSKLLAVARLPGNAKLYDLDKHQELEIQGTDSFPYLSFEQGGKFLRLTRRSGRAQVSKIWDVENRREVSHDKPATQSESDSQRSAVSVPSPLGDTVATAQGESIKLSDAKTGRVISKNEKSHLLPVKLLAFSPDGNTLVSGSIDGAVKVWNARNLGTALYDIPVFDKPITWLGFSPDGRRLALSDGLEIVLWDLLAQKPLLRLKGKLPESAAFSRDGMAMGGHTLGTLWLGAPETEPDKVTNVRGNSTTTPGPSPMWMASRDAVPISDNALIAGYAGDDSIHLLSVCRASYEHNAYAGYAWGGDCHFGVDGRELRLGIYELLTKPDTALWLGTAGSDSRNRSATLKKLSVGQRDGREVVVCRAYNLGSLYIGWTVGDVCHLGNGSDVSEGKFQILHTRP